ncbi:M48 family metalloprotease [Pseudanabaena sp. UWO311]|uniref:M48 family metallopeptidase n=1 Tax=Pseudanabaena sp. UWO311 TaxID=2487337 RepID=UPI0011576A67|nr:M48 family metallopeptidase [Pseudanabaena sp. UWO311]TYQ23540.1 M48 family metalloprotease [Pseudanabaena sp. UWO311]
MTQEKFDELVQQLEVYSQQHPNLYKLRVAALATFGYVYIFVAIAFLLWCAVLIAFIAIYGRFFASGLFAILIVSIFLLLRSLWVTFPDPTGNRLKRKQVPELFALVKRLTKSLQAPQFHQIILTSEFNASVVQVPRLGIFGWQKNYLILGLPLMQALSPEQFQAVLAHEIGHLSGNHSRFAGWIYRVRKTWMQILERFQTEQGAEVVAMSFYGFINWYSPLLSAYSFVLARANEYEADRCAADSVGNQHTAEALILVGVRSQYIDNSYWKNIYLQVNTQPEPPNYPFAQLAQALQDEIAPETYHKLLARSLTLKTDTSDTHPCLRDRLQALGFNPSALPMMNFSPVTASQKFLGSALANLTEQFDREWYRNVEASWKERFTYIQGLRTALQAIEEKAKSEILNLTEAWNRAFWTSEIMGDRMALPFAQNVVAMQADHAGANYLLGKVLIEDEDPKGIEHLEIAMQGDVDAVIPSCELIYGFLKQNGKNDEALEYEQKLAIHYQKVGLAQQERASVSCFDALITHDLPEEEVKRLHHYLSGYKDIETVYLVRKHLKHFPEKPMFVLAIKCKHSFWTKFHLSARALEKEKKVIAKIANEFQFVSHTYVTVFASDSSFRKNDFPYVISEDYIKKVAGRSIYQA